MSKKADLIRIFKEYKTRYELLQQKLTEVRNSELYTEAGLEDAVRKITEEFGTIVDLCHNRAIEIIDEGLKGLAEKWKKGSTSKLTDVGYQAGLANVVKMLEIGSVQNSDDLQGLIDAYTGDFSALAMIRKALHDSEINYSVKSAVKIPEDKREKNIRLLNQLKNNVDQYINRRTFENAVKTWNSFNHSSSNTAVSMSMDSMAEFVETRLDNDLELLN